MINPLATLANQLGVSPAVMAEAARISPELAVAALTADPPEPLCSYLKMMKALRLRVRFEAVSGFGFWISLARADELIFDNDFRRHVSLLPAGRTYAELRQSIAAAMKRSRSSHAAMQALERDIVPTSQGRRQWSRQVVLRGMRALPGEKDDYAVKAGDECLRDWRRAMPRLLLAELCPQLPMAVMTFDFKIKRTTERIEFHVREPIPRCAVEWITASLDRMPWLAGAWGPIIEATGARHEALQA